MASPYKLPNVVVTVAGADEKAIRIVELFLRHRLASTGVLMLGPEFPAELEEELDYKLDIRVKMHARSVAIRSVNTSKKATVPTPPKRKVKLKVRK